MAQLDIRNTIRTGLILGVAALSVSAIGMVETFDRRDIVAGLLTLGQLLLFSTPLVAGYMVGRQETGHSLPPRQAVGHGLLAGVATSLPIMLLVLWSFAWEDIRSALVNVSPTLIEILTLGQNSFPGSLLVTAVMGGLGALGIGIHLIPGKWRRPLLNGVFWTLGMGMLSEILLNVLRSLLGRQLVAVFFGNPGITVLTAVLTFVIAVVLTFIWHNGGQARYEARRARMTAEQQTRTRQSTLTVLGVLMLILPFILGTYLTEVLDNVGLFILMGLGLNIVVGFAGLLDLGYVAFFAIGAYVMGFLTSTGALGGSDLSFWAAVPVSVLVATLAGVTLGVPVLRMRGDYLAIVTLGFGEIIRVLATSDLLKPYIGGAQGILQIPKPQIPMPEFLCNSFSSGRPTSFFQSIDNACRAVFIQPEHFYYLILAGCLLVAFVSWRLRDARLGRQWMAMREDEDVAEAMGIHLVKTKLLAFGIGAAFSGLAGAIFASRLSSIFPHSFNLLISINVLSLIIVGGVGSLPGVIVGALVLVGLPELLREFAEYRLLLYGVLLIVMMINRPEGLWPSSVIRREMHAADDLPLIEEST